MPWQIFSHRLLFTLLTGLAHLYIIFVECFAVMSMFLRDRRFTVRAIKSIDCVQI
jgi:hypothetical protein